MGIGGWLGWGKAEPAPPVHAVPTSEHLIEALTRVETLARQGAVPGPVMSRLARVTRVVRDTIPRLDALGAGSVSAYNVMATATDYLPEAIGGYLRLPRQWADSRPVDRGKTSLMILIDQLDLLGATMDKVFDAVCRSDAEALVVHGRFLQEKFGSPSGGSLALQQVAAPPAPDPTSASPSPGPAVSPAPSPAESPRLAPPTGREP